MIGQLTSLALMLAAILFALSLPLGDGDAARALRRAAAFCFLLAFVPATLAYVFAPLLHWPHSVAGTVELLLAAMGVLGILVVFSLASYGLIDLRKRGGSRQPKPHAERGYTKRRPSDRGHSRDGDDGEDEEHES